MIETLSLIYALFKAPSGKPEQLGCSREIPVGISNGRMSQIDGQAEQRFSCITVLFADTQEMFARKGMAEIVGTRRPSTRRGGYARLRTHTLECPHNAAVIQRFSTPVIEEERGISAYSDSSADLPVFPKHLQRGVVNRDHTQAVALAVANRDGASFPVDILGHQPHGFSAAHTGCCQQAKVNSTGDSARGAPRPEVASRFQQRVDLSGCVYERLNSWPCPTTEVLSRDMGSRLGYGAELAEQPKGSPSARSVSFTDPDPHDIHRWGSGMTAFFRKAGERPEVPLDIPRRVSQSTTVFQESIDSKAHAVLTHLEPSGQGKTKARNNFSSVRAYRRAVSRELWPRKSAISFTPAPPACIRLAMLRRRICVSPKGDIPARINAHLIGQEALIELSGVRGGMCRRKI